MVNETELPSPLWHRQPDETNGIACVCKVTTSSVPTSQPAVISHCLETKSNLMWSLFIHNHHVDVDRCAALSSVPKILDVASLSHLLSCLEALPVCLGHPDMHFMEMVNAKKGQLRGHTGDVVAFTDSYAPVHLNGKWYARTVLTSSCELLLHTDKCSPCNEYCPHL